MVTHNVKAWNPLSMGLGHSRLVNIWPCCHILIQIMSNENIKIYIQELMHTFHVTFKYGCEKHYYVKVLCKCISVKLTTK